MAKGKEEMISHTHMDILQEISNIGLGNAATALAEMLNKRVSITVPHAAFLDLEHILPLVGGLEEVVACVNLSFDGDIAGTVMFIFQENDTYKLVDVLLAQEVGTTRELDTMGQSAIMEIGNVLTGSFMNAISSMTGLTMHSSVPLFAFDMVGAILSTALVAGGHYDDQVLLIETMFLQDNDRIKGHFFLMPENSAQKKLIEALSMAAEC